MKDFIKHFRRDRDGTWSCLSHADVMAVSGRIQVTGGSCFAPGTIFMGVDIVQLLEQELHRINGSSRPASQFPPDSTHDLIRALA